MATATCQSQPNWRHRWGGVPSSPSRNRKDQHALAPRTPAPQRRRTRTTTTSSTTTLRTPPTRTTLHSRCQAWNGGTQRPSRTSCQPRAPPRFTSQRGLNKLWRTSSTDCVSWSKTRRTTTTQNRKPEPGKPCLPPTPSSSQTCAAKTDCPGANSSRTAWSRQRRATGEPCGRTASRTRNRTSHKRPPKLRKRPKLFPNSWRQGSTPELLPQSGEEAREPRPEQWRRSSWRHNTPRSPRHHTSTRHRGRKTYEHASSTVLPRATAATLAAAQRVPGAHATSTGTVWDATTTSPARSRAPCYVLSREKCRARYKEPSSRPAWRASAKLRAARASSVAAASSVGWSAAPWCKKCYPSYEQLSAKRSSASNRTARAGSTGS